MAAELGDLDIAGRIFTPPVPERYGRDYGNVRRAVPRAVCVAASVSDVQAVVRWARRTGLRVVPRGHACSSGGQTLTGDVVLDLTGLADVRWTRRGTVCAGGGCSWGALHEQTMARGQSPPVLVNNALATVGGTLAVGGFGARSFRRGPLVSHVRSLEMVTGTGKRIRTDEATHPELFTYALAGLGQAGIITAAELDLTTRAPYAEIVHRWYPGSESPARIARRVRDEPDWDIALLLYLLREERWKLVLGRSHIAAPSELPGESVLVRDYHRDVSSREAAFVPELEAAHVQSGRMPATSSARRLWSDFLLPAETSSEFFQALRALFHDSRMLWGFYGAVLARDEWDRPVPVLAPVPGSNLIVTMGPYCVVPPGHVDDYRERFDRAADICLSLGGKIYLYGQVPRVPDLLARQYGTATVDSWRMVRRAYDPDGVIGSSILDAAGPCAGSSDS